MGGPIEKVEDPTTHVLNGRRAVLISMDLFVAFMTR